MPQDRDLYGRQPAKKKKTTGELDLSNTLGFAAQLQSIISSKSSASSAPSSSARKRPRQDDAATESAPKAKNAKGPKGKASWIKGPSQSAGDASSSLDEHERERIRKSMAAKARRYAEMQRGDYQPREGEAASLVDFDRKWAEKVDRHSDHSSSSDSSSSSDDEYGGSDFERDRTTMVEFVDEYGRTREVSKLERDRALRRQARAQRAARALDAMSARPAAPADPSRIIYGNAIQTNAIETVHDRFGTMPPRVNDDDDTVADTHYRASDDVRTRGAAFYAFAADDEAKRAAQMQALAEERAKTEAARAEKDKARAERSAKLEERRQDMAARRAALQEKKAKRQADSFLDELGKDLVGGE